MKILLVALVTLIGLCALYLSTGRHGTMFNTPPRLLSPPEEQLRRGPSPVARSADPNRPPAPVYRSADDEWPPSDVLKDYRKAQSLYMSGDYDEALRQVRRTVPKKLVLVPEDALSKAAGESSDNLYLRTANALGVFSAIRHENDDFASSLLRQDKKNEALAILATNAVLSRAMVQASPPTLQYVFMGNQTWELAWSAIAKVLEDQKRMTDSEAATGYSLAAGAFFRERIQPEIRKQRAQTERACVEFGKLPRDRQEQYDREQKKMRVKVELRQRDCARLLRVGRLTAAEETWVTPPGFDFAQPARGPRMFAFVEKCAIM
jgi:predicted Zn-dependent protease